MTNSETPQKPGRKKQGAALAAFRTAALQITPQEIACYEPTAEDTALAEAMLAGNVLLGDLAREANLPAERTGQILRDPTRCAWICQQVSKLVETRLGMIDATMYNRAVSGDVRAAETMYKRFDALKQVHRTESAATGLENLSDEELRTIVKELAQRLAIDVEFTTLPAPAVAPETKELPADGTG